MSAISIAAMLLQVVAIVALAPLVQGTMKLLRARLQGRPGASPLQPYRDLAKLWQKEALLPAGVSFVTLAAPGVVLGVALTFVAALPLGPRGGIASFADAVALVLLLALGRFALILAALDTRSSFSGMAASREATFGALVEPALLLSLLGAAAMGGGTKLSALAALPLTPASVLAFAAFFLVSLAETARVPIDNQETHYELTMIHEGLVLEYSGWQLALLQGAAYVKQVGFLLLAGMLLPGPAWWAHAGWALAIACGITLVETALAKLRLFEVPQVLGTAFILAATSIGLRFFGGMP
ncbi:MAG: respiratory chain complex I subunit 1 family protein [Vulcanimicrobiaceae bacterium]